MNTIIIPIYYEDPTRLDKLSISSLMKNLNDINEYDINFVCPSIETSNWKELVTKGKATNFKIFDDSFFLSTQSYSKMLESYEFWNEFAEYDYALVYQTDGYCIGGSLSDFLYMDYDYIGAPIVAENARWFNVPAIGNGGVSLRKITTMLETTDPNGEFIIENKEDILKHNQANSNMYDIYEDLYFAQLVPMLWDFKKSKFDVATSFAYDMNADIVYEKTNHKLPLFIHAFDKNIRFWQNILDEFKDINIISDCEWKNKDGYLSSQVNYQGYLIHEEPINVVAIMIIKNENWHLNDQISKLRNSGIRKVIIIDNNDISSSEDPSNVIEDMSDVEVISRFRGEHTTDSYDLITEAYRYAYENYTFGYSHVIFIDADEELKKSSFVNIAYSHDVNIIKIPVVNVDINNNKSEYQENKFKCLVKTGLNFMAFNREGPITNMKFDIDENVILNHITYSSKKEFDLHKKYRGYPDKDYILGKKLTNDELYRKVNKVSTVIFN